VRPDASLRSVVAAVSAISKTLSKFDTVSEAYLDSLIDHYKSEAKAKISNVQSGSMSATRYVQWIVSKVEEERDRARTCLDEPTAVSAVYYVREHLGSAQYANFIQTGEPSHGSRSAADGSLGRSYGPGGRGGACAVVHGCCGL